MNFLLSNIHVILVPTLMVFRYQYSWQHSLVQYHTECQLTLNCQWLLFRRGYSTSRIWCSSRYRVVDNYYSWRVSMVMMPMVMVSMVMVSMVMVITMVMVIMDVISSNSSIDCFLVLILCPRLHQAITNITDVEFCILTTVTLK